MEDDWIHPQSSRATKEEYAEMLGTCDDFDVGVQKIESKILVQGSLGSATKNVLTGYHVKPNIKYF